MITLASGYTFSCCGVCMFSSEKSSWCGNFKFCVTPTMHAASRHTTGWTASTPEQRSVHAHVYLMSYIPHVHITLMYAGKDWWSCISTGLCVCVCVHACVPVYSVLVLKLMYALMPWPLAWTGQHVNGQHQYMSTHCTCTRGCRKSPWGGGRGKKGQ